MMSPNQAQRSWASTHPPLRKPKGVGGSVSSPPVPSSADRTKLPGLRRTPHSPHGSSGAPAHRRGEGMASAQVLGPTAAREPGGEGARSRQQGLVTGASDGRGSAESPAETLRALEAPARLLASKLTAARGSGSNSICGPGSAARAPARPRGADLRACPG